MSHIYIPIGLDLTPDSVDERGYASQEEQDCDGALVTMSFDMPDIPENVGRTQGIVRVESPLLHHRDLRETDARY